MNFKILKIFILLTILFSIGKSNTLEVKLFGTRKDIRFLSIEGDIIMPLMYEFDDRDLVFTSINLDSSNNYKKFSDVINEAGGESALPFIVIDDKLLSTSEINKETLSKIINSRAFRKDSSKRIDVNKEKKTTLKKYSDKPVAPVNVNNEDMIYTNIFVAIVIVIGGIVVYYSRKNLLK